MKNTPCVDEFLKVNAAPLPVIQVDGTVTLCNRQPYPHTKVPMCLYDVKLKDKPDLHICVGFELSDKQWILSDLPKLSCTYLTPLVIRSNHVIFNLIYYYILLHDKDRCDSTLEHSRISCLQNNTKQIPLHLCMQLQYQYAVEKFISQSISTTKSSQI